MAIDQADIDFALDLFSGLAPLSTKKMFGGVAFYSGGTIFAAIKPDGQLMLKGAGPFIEQIEALGGQHWTFVRSNGNKGSMPYWSLPDAYLEDPEAATVLAQDALRHL